MGTPSGHIRSRSVSGTPFGERPLIETSIYMLRPVGGCRRVSPSPQKGQDTGHGQPQGCVASRSNPLRLPTDTPVACCLGISKYNICSPFPKSPNPRSGAAVRGQPLHNRHYKRLPTYPPDPTLRYLHGAVTLQPSIASPASGPAEPVREAMAVECGAVTLGSARRSQQSVHLRMYVGERHAE